MNKYLLFLILFTFHSANIYSQTCGNDSVVTRYTQENDNGTRTNIIYVDSFDLTSGTVYSSRQEIANNNSGNIIRTQGTFIRKMISYNSVQDTIEYIELQGTGSGYTNLNKIQYTYTPSEKPLTRVMLNWNGSAWSISKSEIWTYDVSELLQNYILSDSTGNIAQRNYSYSGNQQTSVQFQNYTSGNWLNTQQYLITYNQNSLRDSFYLQRWDNISGLWQDSIHAKYDTVQYHVNLQRDNQNGYDSSFYSLDSLNNILHFLYKANDNSYKEWFDYNYFNHHLKIIYHESYSPPFLNNTNYLYTGNGLLLRTVFDASSNTGYNYGTSQYDSLSNLIFSDNDSHHMSGDHTTKTCYSYSSANHISLFYVFTTPSQSGYTCQGDSIRAIPIIAGGCGPYTYSWNPSMGLSNNSIASPLVLFKDSILYTITVTDSIGQSASTTFLAEPDRKLVITFDSTLCLGCPVVLQATPGYLDYYWYKNDTLLIIGSSTFIAVESGIYKVEVHNFCDMISDPVNLTLAGYSRIQGHVFLDNDTNCVFDGTDVNLSGYDTTEFQIRIESDNYSATISVDSSGYYFWPIDTGFFSVTVINPTTVYNNSCPDSGVIHVYIPAYGDTITNTDFAFKTEVIITGQSEKDYSKIKVFPNPSKGTFNVEAFSGDKNVSVTDLTGRMILNFKTTEKDFRISIPDNFSAGTYYLSVRDIENIWNRKIIVQP